MTSAMNDRKPASPDAAQRARFEEAARALGADEDEAAFKAKLEKIARQQPQGEPTEKPKPKTGNAGA